MSKFNKAAAAKSLDSLLEGLAQAEKLTKKALGTFSREALVYVLNTEDIQPINKLLNVLTPMNERVSVEFFRAFTPFKFDKDSLRFAGINKKQREEKGELAIAFLEDDANDIWTWANKNINIEPKPKNYAAKITALVIKARKLDDAEGIDTAEVLQAVMAAGITAADLLTILAQAANEEVQAERVAVAV